MSSQTTVNFSAFSLKTFERMERDQNFGYQMLLRVSSFNTICFKHILGKVIDVKNLYAPQCVIGIVPSLSYSHLNIARL